jgi:FMN-dependent NADH-azoreductase
MDHHRHRYSGADSTQLDSRVIRVRNEILRLSDQLTEEVLSSGLLVIASAMWNFGLAMWNFGLPTSLKAWVDNMFVRGRHSVETLAI